MDERYLFVVTFWYVAGCQTCCSWRQQRTSCIYEGKQNVTVTGYEVCNVVQSGDRSNRQETSGNGLVRPTDQFESKRRCAVLQRRFPLQYVDVLSSRLFVLWKWLKDGFGCFQCTINSMTMSKRSVTNPTKQHVETLITIESVRKHKLSILRLLLESATAWVSAACLYELVS